MAGFATTSGLFVLDVTDEFINQFGIMAVALVTVLAVTYAFRKLPELAEHLNRRSTFKVGLLWRILVGVLVPLALAYMLYSQIKAKIEVPYGSADGYAPSLVTIFGWGMVFAVIVLSVVLSLIPWGPNSKAKNDPEYAHFLKLEDYPKDTELIQGSSASHRKGEQL